MFNSTEYWQGVRAEQAKIANEFPILISVDNPLRGWVGGTTVEVKREAAAKFICDGSHRLATAEEIEQHGQGEQRRKTAAQSEAMRKACVGVFTLAPAAKGK